MTTHTILVGYDGFDHHEQLPELAATLARHLEARLRVVHVLPPLPADAWSSSRVSNAELSESLREHRRATLEALLEPLQASGLEVSSTLREGVPHVELIREAVARAADLVIVVDEVSYREGGRSFGATTMKLLRDCPCPVLATRSRGGMSYRRIMAAVDIGPDGAPENLPNRAILEMAIRLARSADTEGAELVILHAWSLWAEQTLKWRGELSDAEMDELRTEAERLQRERLEALLARHPMDDVAHRVVLSKGAPDAVIPVAVVEEQIDLLVMGTVARTGIPGLVIGNTAERILNGLVCSVLTVKPDGFVTPVV